MLLILGMGYTGTVLAQAARDAGIRVCAVKRQAAPGVLAFDDPTLPALLHEARWLLSSVPPADGGDPVLQHHGEALRQRRGWTGYLSSAGVYGDAGGAWVDESAPIGTGRRQARAMADRAWQALGATVLRLPGIYGPGRSVLDRVRAGDALRVDQPGHRFNRIHVQDIAGAVLHAMQRPAGGVFNLADDWPEEPRRLTEYGCALLGAPLPPLLPLADAPLSPAARAFWTEHRLLATGRMRRVLGYRLRYPDYRAGLLAIHTQELAAASNCR